MATYFWINRQMYFLQVSDSLRMVTHRARGFQERELFVGEWLSFR